MNESEHAQLMDAMSDMHIFVSELETIMYAVGDSPIKPDEDKILNLLIGVKELYQTRYEKLWSVYNTIAPAPPRWKKNKQNKEE